MTLYLFLSLLAFLLYLQANIYLLRVLPKSTINILFSLKLFALGWVALFIFISHFTDQNKIVYIFDRLSVFGWLSFPILASLFFYKSSGIANKTIEVLVKYLLTPIAIAILLRYLYQPETLKYYYQGESGIWYFKTNINSFWTNLSTFYLFVNSTIVIYSFARWFNASKKGNYRKERIKTRIVFISLLLFIFISLLSHIFLPMFGSPSIPPMLHIAALPLMTGLFLSTVTMRHQTYFYEMISHIFINRIKEFVFYLDHNENIYSVNRFTIDHLGYSISEISKYTPYDLFKPKAIIQKLLKNATLNKNTKHEACILVTESDNPIPVSVNVAKLYGAFNNMVGFLIIAEDSRQQVALENEYKKRIHTEKKLQELNIELSKRIELRQNALIKSKQKLIDEQNRYKSTEKQIIKELKNKEEILREIHHRVKNNIQIIISLINMEQNSPYIKTGTRNILAGIAGRIRDISMIHDLLYDSPYMGKIQFNKFILKTINELKAKHQKTEQVFFNIRVSKDEISIDQAIPCGIIFYELINNALKYGCSDKPSVLADTPENGFSMAGSITISIEFYKERENYFLSVKDNGRGINLVNNLPAKKKMGLKLVETLVNEYLHGKINYNADNGTSINVSFYCRKAQSITNSD